MALEKAKAEAVQPTFAPLRLSLEDTQRLQDLACGIVDEQLRVFRSHVRNDRGRVSPTRWKSVRRRERVEIFQERSSFQRANGGVEQLPALLGVGTLAGDLEDVMYGVVNSTHEAMQLKSGYTADGLDRSALLATVQEPVAGDPFRSLSVKWAAKKCNPCLHALTKDPDFVYLEATGIRRLDDGTRVGFQLLHSVQFPELGALADFKRDNMSMCCVYRQQTCETVELFMRGFLDSRGAVVRSLVVKSAADGMLSIVNNIFCAKMKKLAWSVRRARAKSHGVQLRSASESAVCTSCNKRSACGAAPGTANCCGVCFKHVCRWCRIRQRLGFFGPARRLSYEQVSFCAQCLTNALETSADAVATDEILAQDAYLAESWTLSLTSDSDASTQSTEEL